MGSSLSGPAQGGKDNQSGGAKGKAKETAKEDRVWKGIARLPFGYQLELVVPSAGGSTSTLPTGIDQLIQAEAGFQLVSGINLADLLVPGFMNDYLRKGSLIALSIDTSGSGDVICIDGRGRLILHLTKDTYELLGIPGRPSKFGALRHEFVVEIDLRDEAFRAGKKGFERTRGLLKAWPARVDLFDELAGVAGRSAQVDGEGRRWDVLFAFVDDDGQPQPITFPPSIRSTSHTPTPSSDHLTFVPLPTMPLLPPRPTSLESKRPRTSADSASVRASDELEEWEDGLQAARDWLGLARVGAGEKLREVKEGEVAGQQGEVLVARWEGFWHPGVVRRVVQKALAGLNAATPPPFLSISLSVPPSAPISHLAAKPVPATRRRPGSDSRGDAKRGRGTGEDDERDAASARVEGGWELVVEEAGAWAFWERQ